MHPTLSPNGNLLQAFIWAAIAIVITALYLEFAVLSATGLAFGLVAGLLQARALRENPERFRAATTGHPVRNAFATSTPGKAAIIMGWLLGVVSLLLWWWISPRQGILGVLAAYMAFMFARELLAFSALRQAFGRPQQ